MATEHDEELPYWRATIWVVCGISVPAERAAIDHDAELPYCRAATQT